MKLSLVIFNVKCVLRFDMEILLCVDNFFIASIYDTITLWMIFYF